MFIICNEAIRCCWAITISRFCCTLSTVAILIGIGLLFSNEAYGGLVKADATYLPADFGTQIVPYATTEGRACVNPLIAGKVEDPQKGCGKDGTEKFRPITSLTPANATAVAGIAKAKITPVPILDNNGAVIAVQKSISAYAIRLLGLALEIEAAVKDPIIFPKGKELSITVSNSLILLIEPDPIESLFYRSEFQFNLTGSQPLYTLDISVVEGNTPIVDFIIDDMLINQGWDELALEKSLGEMLFKDFANTGAYNVLDFKYPTMEFNVSADNSAIFSTLDSVRIVTTIDEPTPIIFMLIGAFYLSYRSSKSKWTTSINA